MEIFIFRILLVLYRKEYSSTLNAQGLEMLGELAGVQCLLKQLVPSALYVKLPRANSLRLFLPSNQPSIHLTTLSIQIPSTYCGFKSMT